MKSFLWLPHLANLYLTSQQYIHTYMHMTSIQICAQTHKKLNICGKQLSFNLNVQPFMRTSVRCIKFFKNNVFACMYACVPVCILVPTSTGKHTRSHALKLSCHVIQSILNFCYLVFMFVAYNWKLAKLIFLFLLIFCF